MDAATSWLVRRKDAFLRETGTRKAAQVTFFTPYGCSCVRRHPVMDAGDWRRSVDAG